MYVYYNGQKKRRLAVEKMGKPARKVSEKTCHGLYFAADDDVSWYGVTLFRASDGRARRGKVV
jgi:hypothetical protein